MAVRKLKPTTPGQRHKIIGAFDTITASAPEKSLVVGVRKSGGRNNEGHLTMRYIGCGHKRKYRLIDFKRNKDGVFNIEEFDPDPFMDMLNQYGLPWVVDEDPQIVE